MLTNELRPKTWDQVYGNAAAVKVLRRNLEEGSIRVFFLEGPAGIGKTTLARIAAQELGCSANCIREINGAESRGIEEWRAHIREMRLRPMHGSIVAWIVDECQQLTNEAWQALLKPTEEPADHIVMFFCTTMSLRDFPKTVASRVQPITLKAPSDKDLDAFVGAVCKEQGIKLSKDVRRLLVSAGQHSFRMVLQRLDALRVLETDEEQLSYLEPLVDDFADFQPDVRSFCNHLLQAPSARWLANGVELLNKLKDKLDAEGLRQVVYAYMTTICLSCPPNDDKHQRAVLVIRQFSTNYPPITRKLAGALNILHLLAQSGS